MKLNRFAWLAPLAATLTAGCFATRNDVRLLKADIERMHNEAEANRKTEADRARADQARRDSANAMATRRLEAAVASLLDTVRSLGDDVGRLRASTTVSIAEIQSQIETIQRMVGVTQQQIRDAAARAEARTERTASAGAADSGGVEGPIALYQIGVDQLNKQAYGQARNAFQEVIDKFSKDTLVADARYQIGFAYSLEHQDAKADSVWASVVRLHPNSDRAPTALYKRGFLNEEAGRTEEARRIYNQVIKDYESSNEAALARSRLAGLIKR